ncbi:VOC family protein [Brachybacterium sp. UNK5269]|uniref:VOC family protein n=1 Tax=Brachybacterium sp. UNK5269 TaxID=3408576 RepID=UPI003BAF8D3C
MFLENLVIDAVDPLRLGRFWAAALGTTALTHQQDLYETRLVLSDGAHLSRRGPLLELCPEPEPKRRGQKNRIHLDVRLEADDDADAVAAGIQERGGRELHPGWGDLPWRVHQDPSGTEFCVLTASGAGA